MLQAVGEKFCTVEGMLKFIEPQIEAEINKSDFDAVLHKMCSDSDLVKANNGGFSAYFPADRIPTSFFRAGGGKINALYEDEKVGLPVTLVEFDGAALPVEEIAVLPYFTQDQLALIENLAAKCYTTREIAGELLVDASLFARRARHDLATRTAIAKGWKRKEESGSTESVSENEHQETTCEVPPRKPKQRVEDVRPAARVVITEFTDGSETEPFPRRKSLSDDKPKRLCACGDPLGARVRECKNCWLESKGKITPRVEQENDPTTDRKIKEVLANTDFDREKLSEIAIELFLEFAPAKVKQKLAERLWQELTAGKPS